MAATIAHEFNNVLMGIQPFTELLSRYTAGDPKLERPLSYISSAVQRGSRITQEILRFSRPAEPDLQSIAVDEWLESFAAELPSLLGGSIAVEIYGEPGLTIWGDPDQLHQVIINFAVNARDAMVKGGRIEVQAKRCSPEGVFSYGVVANPQYKVHLSFRDNGNGMPPEVLKNIFEPLFTTKRKGTGLGLAVAHQIIDQHHGEVFAESIEGSGTTFHLFLPIPQAALERVPDEEQVSGSGLPERVLIVEDDFSVAEGLREILSSEGITVCLVDHGEAAMVALAEFDPQAVVLDVGLPDIDGVEVCRRIRKTRPDLPVIFSTGHGDRASIVELLGSGTTEFLMKPYDVDDLLEILVRMHQGQSGRGPLGACGS